MRRVEEQEVTPCQASFWFSCTAWSVDRIALGCQNMAPVTTERFPSGQREQTVNLPRKLRRFESFPLHQIAEQCKSAVFMRAWYNGRTSAFQADDAGSIPAARSMVKLM